MGGVLVTESMDEQDEAVWANIQSESSGLRGDLNGDGRVDLVVTRELETAVHLSSGEEEGLLSVRRPKQVYTYPLDSKNPHIIAIDSDNRVTIYKATADGEPILTTRTLLTTIAEKNPDPLLTTKVEIERIAPNSSRFPSAFYESSIKRIDRHGRRVSLNIYSGAILNGAKREHLPPTAVFTNFDKIISSSAEHSNRSKIDGRRWRWRYGFSWRLVEAPGLQRRRHFQGRYLVLEREGKYSSYTKWLPSNPYEGLTLRLLFTGPSDFGELNATISGLADVRTWRLDSDHVPEVRFADAWPIPMLHPQVSDENRLIPFPWSPLPSEALRFDPPTHIKTGATGGKLGLLGDDTAMAYINPSTVDGHKIIFGQETNAVINHGIKGGRIIMQVGDVFSDSEDFIIEKDRWRFAHAGIIIIRWFLVGSAFHRASSSVRHGE